MRKMWLAGAAMLAGMTTFAGMAAAQQAQGEGADVTADAATTGRLNPGQSLTGVLTPAGDQDGYRIRLAANRTYHFTLNGAGESALGDPLLMILGPNGGEPIAFNDDSGGTLNSALDFTPTAAGDYILVVRGFIDEAEGTYELTASQGVVAPRQAADVSADATTRGRLSIGRSVTASLQPAGDQDWYRIRLTAGQPYRFTLNGTGAEALGDPLLQLIGPQGGEPIAYNDDSEGSLNSLLEFTPETSGNYFLGVRGFVEGATGTYELAAARIAPPPRLALTGGAGSVTAAIDTAGEHDRYSVALTGGETYRFSLNGAGEPALGDPLLLVYGANASSPIGGDDDGGEGLNSYYEFTAPTTGNYVIEARSYNPAGTGGYTLSVRPGDVPNNAQTDIALNPAGDSRADRLHPAGDTDWFRIDLTEGQTIRVHMLSGQSGAPLADPLIAIHGADGEVAAVDDDGGEGLNAFLEFTAPAAGAYYIEARGFQDAAEGAYSLHVLPGEIPSAVGDGGETLTPNEPRVSQIGAAGDSDWFAVNMIEGRTYRFQAQGSDGDGDLADPLLTLRGPDGAELAADDDGGTGVNPQITYTARTSGIHFIAVSAFGGQATGRYGVRVLDNEVPGSVDTDDTLTGQDDSRESRIDFPGDRDFYRVIVEAGHSYTVRAAAAAEYGLADPTIAVLDSAGQEIGSNDNENRRSRSAALNFVAPAGSDMIYVAVGGADGGVGGYVVTIAATQ